jgi:hypothetical protein
MNWLGDVPEDYATVVCMFTTHDGNGAPVAPLSAFEAADVKIYKNGVNTEKTTTNGVTMTSPFDSIVGLHCVVIDTSNDTGDSGFWTTGGGGTYTIVLNPDTETVNGQTALKVLGQFGIALSPALRPTTAGRTLDVSATGEAGIDWANVGSPTTSLALTGTTIASTQKVDVDTIKTNPVANGGTVTFPTNATLASTTGTVGSVTGAVGSVTGLTASDVGAIKTKTDFLPSATAGAAGGVFIAGTNAATTITTALTTTFTGNLTGSVGSVTGLTASNLDATISSRLAPTTAGRTLDVTATGEAGVDWANIGSPTTVVNLSGTNVQGVNSLASGSDAVSTVATSGSTLTTGSTIAGSYSSTAQTDGTYWQVADTTGSLDMYFEFNVGTLGVPTSAVWTGGLTTAVNTLKVYAYNWAGASWDQVGTLAGTSALVVNAQEFEFTTVHVGTGGNLGLVRLRFANTGLVSANFYTDRVLCGYTSVYSFPSNFSSLAIDGSGRVTVGSIVNGAIAAATFAANALDAVWSTATRLLTAGTNIALAKGTGVTGFNDLSAAEVNAEADTALADVGLTGTITGRIDAAISTRLPTSGYTAPLDAATTRTAVGLVSANLDTQLGAIAGYIDTEIGTLQTTASAIKAKTDSLTFTIAGEVDANMQSINDAALTGTGQPGDKFGPA